MLQRMLHYMVQNVFMELQICFTICIRNNGGYVDFKQSQDYNLCTTARINYRPDAFYRLLLSHRIYNLSY